MSSNPNPAHEEALKLVPQEFHHLLVPVFKKWDQNVQDRFSEINEEYKAFKPFIENNVDPRYILQAVQLADALQDDPKTVIDNMNSTWGLGYVSKEEAEQLVAAGSSTETNDDPFNNNDDILNHPTVKKMQETLDSLQNSYQSDKQLEEEEEALAEFEDYLDGLEETYKEKKLPFNRMVVTALISQGLDGEEAVAQYHKELAVNLNVDTSTNDKPDNEAPVIMGQAGSTGAGVPDGSVDFGALSKGDLNTSIENLLSQRAASGQ